MKNIGIFSTLLVVNLGLCLLGPFLWVGPLLGFPVVFLFTLISMMLYKKTNPVWKNCLISLAVMTILIVLMSLSQGLSLLLVGMLFHAIGVAGAIFVTPLLYERMNKE